MGTYLPKHTYISLKYPFGEYEYYPDKVYVDDKIIGTEFKYLACKKCGTAVEYSVVAGFYSCHKCNSLTNNIERKTEHRI